MDKLRLLDRIMLGRAFAIAMNLATLAIVMPITYREVMDWAAQSGAITATTEGSDELHAAFLRQGAVGIVLVALGVILEGRQTFVRAVLKA